LSLPTVLAVVAVFGLLITVHEFGHFIVAKLNGVKVLEFNVGFGTPLLRTHRGETAYALRAIPLGGYVRLAGMDDGETGPRSFNEKPVWRRVLVIAAGSVTNLVLPLLILFPVVAASAGLPVVVREVIAGRPADKAGLRHGDAILNVDGQPVTALTDVRRLVNGANGQPVVVHLKRTDGALEDVTITPLHVQQKNPQTGVVSTVYMIGIAPGGSFDPVRGLPDTTRVYGGLWSSLLGGYGQLFGGRIPGGLTGPCGISGPVGIVRQTAAAAQGGLEELAFFAAFLSLNIGILNLLPLPALDGGRLAFLTLEAIRGKPIDPRNEQRVHYIGFMVLITLILLISYHDLSQLGAQCQG
jgi:regulator of sigma E protease